MAKSSAHSNVFLRLQNRLCSLDRRANFQMAMGLGGAAWSNSTAKSAANFL